MMMRTEADAGIKRFNLRLQCCVCDVDEVSIAGLLQD